MKENYHNCNFLYSDVLEASIPYSPLQLFSKRFISHIVMSIVYPQTPDNEVLNLQPGDWVQVRSFDEISATLDENGKYKGLYFMPEMKKFCGKKYKVFKKVEIIKLESTGELRKLRSPSVFLEGVYCDGENHDGCDRSCFHFWREMWLQRVNDS